MNKLLVVVMVVLMFAVLDTDTVKGEVFFDIWDMFDSQAAYEDCRYSVDKIDVQNSYVDTDDLYLLSKNGLACNKSEDANCRDFVTSDFWNAKTIYQTDLFYDSRLAIASDAVIVHRHSDSSFDTTKAAINSWKQQGFTVGRMFFSDSDAGDYFSTGLWDGRDHSDDVERDVSGNIIKAGTRPYMNPTAGWINYLTEMVDKSLKIADAEAILPEEPLAHMFSGYEQSFKDIWKEYYGSPWQAENSSPQARFYTGKLKSHLYKELEKQLCNKTKEIANEQNKKIPFVLPIHSIFSNVAAELTAPLGESYGIGADGYIGQVWTGPVNWALNEYDSSNKSFFSSAYALYDYFTQLSVENSKKLWLLVDPVEDDPEHTWTEFAEWYKHCVSAMLFMREVDSYEVMPWPDRIFLPGYETGGGSPAPEDFRTRLLAITQALQDMPLGGQWLSHPTQSIGVAVEDTLMWEENSPRLQSIYGALIPLIEKGVPVNSFVMERAGEPDYRNRFKVIVLSYEQFKPKYVSMNLSLVNWVKNGGVLVVLGPYGDELDSCNDFWWHDLGYNSALEHLIAKLGGVASDNANWEVGDGWVLRRQKSASDFADSYWAETFYYPLLEDALNKAGEPDLQKPGFFKMRRGSFIITHSTTSSVDITGKMVDIFDPDLPVLTNPTINAGDSCLYRDVTNQLQSNQPSILHSTHRLISEDYSNSVLSFVVCGPQDTPAVVRLFYPYSGIENNISVYDSNDQSTTFNLVDDGETFRLNFPNAPDGITVEIDYSSQY